MLSNWLNAALGLVVAGAIITVMLIVVSGCQTNVRPEAAPLIWRK